MRPWNTRILLLCGVAGIALGCCMLFLSEGCGKITIGIPWSTVTPAPAPACSSSYTLNCETGTGADGASVTVTNQSNNQSSTVNTGSNAPNSAVCAAIATAAQQTASPFQSVGLTAIRLCDCNTIVAVTTSAGTGGADICVREKSCPASPGNLGACPP